MDFYDDNAIYDLDGNEILMHYGVGWDHNPPGPGSGRYPHGSGENPDQHPKGLGGFVSDLKKQGMTPTEIAKYCGYNSTTELRSAISRDHENRMRNNIDQCIRYHDQGMSNVAIAQKLGISETSVRNYISPEMKIREDKNRVAANVLKEQLKQKNYIDVTAGTELEMGCSRETLKTAVQMLMDEGYQRYYVKVKQLGTNNQTTIKVLGNPDTDWKTVNNDPTLIKPITDYICEDGKTVLGLEKPAPIDSKRVYINYAEDGGVDKDGLIELRRGVDDISLGNSLYAQVRINVDDTHYMKGMAVYSDNIPDGYDVIYNTNKKKGTAPEDVYKKMTRKENGEIDWDNPFGATIKANGQSHMEDGSLRVINKVNEQGDWANWAKTISPQMLSKQPIPLVRRQLELTLQDKRTELAEIMALTNPTIKRNLLESFADDLDASAVHLKAKAFPGQKSHAIIPIPSMGDDKIYAPNYENGTTVALIRFPHAGTFEIPVLKVDNNNADARRTLGTNAPDAVGITAKVAERLSGADFDGDTVLVIPMTNTNIKSTPALKGLEGFNTKSYKFEDENAPGISSKRKQQEMGKVTNLIADMQIKGAARGGLTNDELVRAVKHSMVVIDSEKHHLNWKQSEIDNRIQELKDKYQDGGGASTLITRAKNELHVDKRKYASVVDPETGKKSYAIDPATGKKILVETGETYTKRNKKTGEYVIDKNTGEPKVYKKTESIPQMAYYDDARELLSSKSNPAPVEVVYANYANQLKAMANEVRREAVNTPGQKRDPQAAKEYAAEVESLKQKVQIAQKNAPRERQAQILGNAIVKQKIAERPEIKEDGDRMKKIRGQALVSARSKVGAHKTRVDITDREWEAIQHRAVSDSMLKQILANTDADALKQRATPRNNAVLSTSKAALAKSMAASGYTQAEIAERIGVSTSTVSRIIAA